MVGAVEDASGGLDLDAPELVGAVAIGIEDEVVGLAVAVGFGGGESEGNDFVEECPPRLRRFGMTSLFYIYISF